MSPVFKNVMISLAGLILVACLVQGARGRAQGQTVPHR